MEGGRRQRPPKAVGGAMRGGGGRSDGGVLGGLIAQIRGGRARRPPRARSLASKKRGCYCNSKEGAGRQGRQADRPKAAAVLAGGGAGGKGEQQGKGRAAHAEKRRVLLVMRTREGEWHFSRRGV